MSIFKYRTLEIGFIYHSEVLYRSVILRKIFENALRWNSGENRYTFSSKSAKFYLCNRNLLRVSHLMLLFSVAWSMRKVRNIEVLGLEQKS